MGIVRDGQTIEVGDWEEGTELRACSSTQEGRGGVVSSGDVHCPAPLLSLGRLVKNRGALSCSFRLQVLHSLLSFLGAIGDDASMLGGSMWHVFRKSLSPEALFPSNISSRISAPQQLSPNSGAQPQVYHRYNQVLPLAAGW